MDGGLENKWLMDSGCSRYMTGDKKWFSSLTPLSHKEYVTFGDDKKDKVLSTGVIKVNNNFTLKNVALVDKWGYNLLSVSQLVDGDLDVPFHKSGSKVLDSHGDPNLVLKFLIQADFSFPQSSMTCLISLSSFELWKWHRRLGYLSFDLLCRLSSLVLHRGLPVLKFESNHVCAPCRHGKMIVVSHSPINTVMTKRPGQLFDMDTIGPSRVRSGGGGLSGTFLSLWAVIHITLGFSSWRARMKCLNTFGAWL
jgi:hypothetical protein